MAHATITPTSLGDALAALLDASKTGLAWTGPAFTWVGEPSFDCCPLLVAHCSGVGIAQSAIGGQAQMSDGGRLQPGQIVTDLTVTVLGCSPKVDLTGDTFTMPDAATMSDFGAVIARDGWHLFNYLREQLRQGLLFGDGEAARFIRFDPMLPIPDQGGCVGWRLNVGVQIDGYAAAAL